MPKIKADEKSLETLYLKVKRKTKNFTEIRLEDLAENPKWTRIFRLLCGKSLVEFGKLINKSYATVGQYEQGIIKSIPQSEAERIVSIIKDEVSAEKTLEQFLANFKKFQQLSKGGAIQAFKRAEKAALTNQEIGVKKVLEKLQIKYEAHKTLDTKVGPLNFDFWVSNKKIMIECTTSLSKQKAESLGFRVIKLKQNMPCKAIAFVKPQISNGVSRRLVDYDHIVGSYVELEHLLRELCFH